MKRIGVFLDSYECDSNLYDMIAILAFREDVELVALVNQSADTPSLTARIRSRFDQEGIYMTMSRAVFAVLTRLEFRLAARLRPAVARHLEHTNAVHLFARKITINPIFSRGRTFVRYPEDDISAMHALKLDLAIRGNNTGIMKGEVLGVAADGILSFHHGDNSWNRGGPPGFWEVYMRKPVTGYVLQILSDSLDGGKVIAAGGSLTQRTFAMNQAHVTARSNPMMISVLETYLETSRLPKARPNYPFGGKLLRAPFLNESLAYILSQVAEVCSFIWTRRIRQLRDRWGIAFLAEDWHGASLRRGRIIESPPGRFFADPFVAAEGGRSVCFFEDFDFATSRGRISAAELGEKGDYSLLGPVLEADHHLSFPYLFRFEGDLYMVPESYESREIVAYRCIEFPMRWERYAVLMENVSAADTIIFEKGGKWWLLTNIDAAEPPDHADELHVFSADYPLSQDWVPHGANPVIRDAERARNGGVLIGEGEKVYRVSQTPGFGVYGFGSAINEITQLDEDGYEEKRRVEIVPEFFPDIKGTHHIASDGKFTVYDFFRREKA